MHLAKESIVKWHMSVLASVSTVKRYMVQTLMFSIVLQTSGTNLIMVLFVLTCINDGRGVGY